MQLPWFRSVLVPYPRVGVASVDISDIYIHPNLLIKHRLPVVTYQLETLGHLKQPGPEVIKHFSCSTQLSMKF